MKKDTSFLMQNLIAHRGKHNIKKGIIENTINAFKEAIENKYIIELDVHVLKDNSVVVFHDDDLKRMTGIDKKLCETTYEEIRKLKLQDTDNYIPLLKEVLNLVDGKVPIIISLKNDTKVGRLEKETIKVLKEYKGKYAIKSFNPLRVLWFKINYPEIIRGQLAARFKKDKMNFVKKIFLRNMWFNFITKPDFVSYNVDSFPNRYIEKYKGKKIILGWTVRNREQMIKAKKYCDNFICENMEEYTDIL